MILSDGEERFQVAGGAAAYYTTDMLAKVGPVMLDPDVTHAMTQDQTPSMEALAEADLFWVEWTRALREDGLSGNAANLTRFFAARLDAYAAQVSAERVKAERTRWTKEAAIAWAVCASIHREYAKGRDALFTTRQADFVKHEDDARRALTDDTAPQAEE